MEPRVAAVEEVAASAHKRIDGVEREVLMLREARHDHANTLQIHTASINNHEKVIAGISESVANLTEVTGANTKEMIKLTATARTILKSGIIFAGVIVFMGGELLEWW